MKIAMFTDTYHPQVNGVVVSIDAFANQLNKNGNEVHIFCPGKEFRSKKTERQHIYGSRWFELKSYKGYRVALPSIYLFRKLKEIDPDVIHIHTPAMIGLMGMLCAKVLNKPAVLHYHTMIEDYCIYLPAGKSLKKVYSFTTKKLTRLLYNRASIIIAPSTETKKFLMKLGIRKKIAVLPTGITLANIKHKTTKKLTVLHVGRLCKERSVDVVIKSFAKLIKNKGMENATLIITSDGPAKKELKALAKSLGIDNIEFTGYVSEERKKKLYQTASVFVTASKTDTQGLVVLEAMNHGMPVVAADAGGLRDFVNNKNGLLFRPDDTNDLSQKLRRIFLDKELSRKFSENARATAKRFSIERCTKELEKIYASAIMQRKQQTG